MTSSVEYTTLTARPLSRDTVFRRPEQQLPEYVRPEDPATDVMTDLTRVSAHTVHESAPIDFAHQRMIKRGVRLLLVVNDGFTIAGLITATDILGEKPMRWLQANGGARSDVLVRHIMTDHAHLETLDFDEVRSARVGQVVATMKRYGRQHALVVEHLPGGGEAVRGLFSTTQIARQLGMDLNHTEIATSFADIHKELG